MFIDSEENSNAGTGFLHDDGYSNHPGFIGALTRGTWLGDIITPGDNEEIRYQGELNAQKSACNYSAGDSCADLEECRKYFQGIYNANTGNSRTPKRKRKAANYHRSKVVGYMSARDCDGGTSAIDIAQEETWQSNENATQAAEDASAAIAQAAADATAAIKAAQQDAIIKVEQEKLKNAQNIQALENTAQIRQEAADAQKLSDDKKNKMMMYGGGAVGIILLVLILNK
jgi:hypothetical protein|tara:strand:- start:1071 stop:1757 length:687 start_codon:yes stop_codon:yes gene_type:complete